MKALIRLAAKIYPRPWRERYGAEFEALLDDSKISAHTAADVVLGGIRIQLQVRRNLIALSALGFLILFTASWMIGRNPYITPGNHQTYRMDGNFGGILGFFWFLAVLVAAPLTFFVNIRDGFLVALRRVVTVTAWVVGPYLAMVLIVALLTPQTIVNIGDGYCWDLWCLGVERVNSVPQGQNVLCTAQVRIFSDANSVPTFREKSFLYVTDEQGRRLPVLPQSPDVPPIDLKINPTDSVTTSFSFLVPAGAGKLYLRGGELEAPWVY